MLLVLFHGKFNVFFNSFIVEVEQHDFVAGLFQDTVNSLTLSPGRYDDVIDGLLETLQMFISKDETMKIIVKILLEQVFIRIFVVFQICWRYIR